MKSRMLTVAFLVLMASVCCAGDTKMIIRDFLVTDTELKPISFGACTWTDKDSDCQLAGYLNVSLMNCWDNHLRIGGGFSITSPDIDDNISRVDMRLVTTVSTLLFDHLELGFYGAPFYNLIERHDNDPWGVMVGYAFGF